MTSASCSGCRGWGPGAPRPPTPPRPRAPSLPGRGRAPHSATRLVYGERQAPDEALRTFGQRLTRAIPMDELLLQLAESLRKTMTLTAAEVWTGGGDVLEREAAVPDRGRGTLAIGAKE